MKDCRRFFWTCWHHCERRRNNHDQFQRYIHTERRNIQRSTIDEQGFRFCSRWMNRNCKLNDRWSKTTKSDKVFGRNVNRRLRCIESQQLKINVHWRRFKCSFWISFSSVRKHFACKSFDRIQSACTAWKPCFRLTCLMILIDTCSRRTRCDKHSRTMMISLFIWRCERLCDQRCNWQLKHNFNNASCLFVSIAAWCRCSQHIFFTTCFCLTIRQNSLQMNRKSDQCKIWQRRCKDCFVCSVKLTQNTTSHHCRDILWLIEPKDSASSWRRLAKYKHKFCMTFDKIFRLCDYMNTVFSVFQLKRSWSSHSNVHLKQLWFCWCCENLRRRTTIFNNLNRWIFEPKDKWKNVNSCTWSWRWRKNLNTDWRCDARWRHVCTVCTNKRCVLTTCDELYCAKSKHDSRLQTHWSDHVHNTRRHWILQDSCKDTWKHRESQYFWYSNWRTVNRNSDKRRKRRF